MSNTQNTNGISVRELNSLNAAWTKFQKNLESFEKASKLANDLGNTLKGTVDPGLKLNSALAGLSSGTGITGKKLKELEILARETAQTFGGTAAQSILAYESVLNGLSPALSRIPGVLAEMGNHIHTLGKIMGGDAAEAADLLISAMKDFKVSAEDPAAAAETMGRMMNTMAAAARSGSAGLPSIGAALNVCGSAASDASVSFEETNAAIQILSEAGKEGAAGGEALRSVFAALSQSEFLPANLRTELAAAGADTSALADRTLSLWDRLEALAPAASDAGLMARLFGEENAFSAESLLANTEVLKEMTSALTDSQSAEEQAAVIMQSKEEQLARIRARIDDYKIALFNCTGNLLPFIRLTTEALLPLSQLPSLLSSAGNLLKTIGSSTIVTGLLNGVKALGAYGLSLITSGTASAKFSAIASTAFNSMKLSAVTACKSIGAAIKSIPVFGWITVVLTALGSAVTWAWDKFEGFRKTVLGAWEVIKGFGSVLKEVFIGTLKSILNGLSNLGAALWKLLKLDFKGAAAAAKQAAVDLFKASPVGIVANVAVKTAKMAPGAYAKGAEKGARSFAADQEKDSGMAVTEQYLDTYMTPVIKPEEIKNACAQAKEAMGEADTRIPIPFIPQVSIPQDLGSKIDEDLKAQLEELRPEIKISMKAEGTGDMEAYNTAITNMNEKIQTATALNTAYNGETNLIGEKVSAAREAIDSLVGAGFDPAGDAVQNMVGQLDEYKQQLGIIDTTQNMLGTTTEETMGKMGNNISQIGGAIGGTAGDWLTFVGNLLSTIPQLIGQFTAFIAAIIAGNTAKQSSDAGSAITGAVAGANTVGFPFNIIAMGISIAATLAALATSVPSFANGGIISGPTMALVGEYMGASNNPEVIAPLSKLKNMLGPADGSGGKVRFEIEGRNLVGIMEKENNRSRRIR